VPKVYWIHPVKGVPRPTLAIVERPRPGKFLARDLEDLHAAGIKVLVSLLTEDEAAYLGLNDEEQAARNAGLEFVAFPMADHHVPRDVDAFRAFVISLATRLFDHEPIGIHCQGSIGRSTLIAACSLIHLGWTPAHALLDVGNARGCPVPDTEEQQVWILNYGPEP
jgi:protein-tyrosine phosphatase